MIQIILNSIPLPESSGDRYACWEEDLMVQVEMITGRMVEESRGTIWRAKWSYDYLDNEMTRRILDALHARGPVQASVLPSGRAELVTGRFLVDSITPPAFLFSEDGIPCWHGLGFTLREVEPHD